MFVDDLSGIEQAPVAAGDAAALHFEMGSNIVSTCSELMPRPLSLIITSTSNSRKVSGNPDASIAVDGIKGVEQHAGKGRRE